jgi:hypothetical protein
MRSAGVKSKYFVRVVGSWAAYIQTHLVDLETFS